MAESDRFNTIAGWTLAAGIVVLGLSAVSSGYFKADKVFPPKEEAAAGGGGAAAVPFETLLAGADPAKGEAAFKKCAACHTANQGGANGVGPNLYGVVGEGVAQGRGGYAFSDALKAKGGKWDFAALNEWLTSPKAFAPGTKMSFAGIGDAAERANLIAWLNTQGSNLPLPKAAPAPAAGAAPTEGAAAAAVVGDAAAGEKSFAKCKACHTINAGGANGIGPNLAGVYGEGVAQGRGGFAFSDALKGKGGKWDDASLDAWLTNPKGFAPGTKMTFAGIADPQERANVIAYLKTAK